MPTFDNPIQIKGFSYDLEFDFEEQVGESYPASSASSGMFYTAYKAMKFGDELPKKFTNLAIPTLNSLKRKYEEPDTWSDEEDTKIAREFAKKYINKNKI